MTLADAFYFVYLGISAGTSLPPGTSITMPEDALKPHAQASSYIQRCEIVGMEIDGDGSIFMDRDGKIQIDGGVRFDCQPRDEPVKIF